MEVWGVIWRYFSVFCRIVSLQNSLNILQKEDKGNTREGEREDKERTKGGQKLKQFLKI